MEQKEGFRTDWLQQSLVSSQEPMTLSSWIVWPTWKEPTCLGQWLQGWSWWWWVGAGEWEEAGLGWVNLEWVKS